MDLNAFDLLAIGLAVGAILMRLLAQPWLSSLMATTSLLFSAIGQIARGQPPPDIEAEE